jgi:hypothetical protein
MRDRCSVETIEFIKNTVDRRVGDEVIDVVVFGSESLGFVYEGRGACERVVYRADEL